MSRQLQQTYEQELVLNAEARGEARGKAQGEAHLARATLRSLLSKRFGPLSPEVLERIDRAALPQLQVALESILDIGSLEDLRLDEPSEPSTSS